MTYSFNTSNTIGLLYYTILIQWVCNGEFDCIINFLGGNISKYYCKDISDEIHVIYGGRQAGKAYYKKTKLITSLSSDEINYIKAVKLIATNLKDEDLIILVKILLCDRYNEFVKYIRKGEE